MVLRKTKRPAKGRPPSITGFVPSTSVDSSVSKESSKSIFLTSNQDSQEELKESVSSIDLSDDNQLSSSPSEKSSITSTQYSGEVTVTEHSPKNSFTSLDNTEEQQFNLDQEKKSETSVEPIKNSKNQHNLNKKNSKDNPTMASAQNNSSVSSSNVSYKDALVNNLETDEKKFTESRSGIKFAPWNVPLVRRRQTLAHVYNLFFYLFCHVLVIFCVFNPLMWPLFVPYLFYISQDASPENGSRASAWYRNLSIWKWYAEFYPARIVKEADLDSSKNYIFGYHPHGIIGMGAFANFATNATGVDKVFPDIFVHPMTLATNFKFPFYREHLLSLGMTSVSKESIRNILSKGPGSSCMIVVGGAEEALEAKPDRAHLILAHRYGFVKMAMQCGADLVPVFGFGENQLYDQADNEHGSWLYYFQQKLKKAAGFTLPLFYGRGVFTYNLGIFPRRIPLTVVTGAPIPVTKCDKPTDEEVQELHHKYLEALTDLYDRNKAAYWVGSNPPELKFF